MYNRCSERYPQFAPGRRGRRLAVCSLVWVQRRGHFARRPVSVGRARRRCSPGGFGDSRTRSETALSAKPIPGQHAFEG